MTREQIFSRLNSLPENPQSVLLLTHTDLDGVGCAVLTSAAFSSSRVDVRHCGNATMSSDILFALNDHMYDYDLILATDISLSEADAVKADKLIHDNFLLLDHHPTAMHLNKYSWACVYGDSIEDSLRAKYYAKNDSWHTSAAGLLFDYIDYNKFACVSEHPLLTEFAYMVSAYDTWDWKNTSCVKDGIADLNTLCYLYGFSRFERAMGLRIASGESLFLPIDNALLEFEHDRIEAYIAKLRDSIITGTICIDGRDYTYAGCISTTLVSAVFEYLREYYDCDVYLVNTGTSISMRANTDIDLATIAKSFNGGGHKAAAGFPIPLAEQKHLLELPFCRDTKTTIFS